MRLHKPSFPVKVSAEDVTAQVQSLLEENGWAEPKIKPPVLVFWPYWFFHFNAFSENTDPETGDKTTAEGEQGTSALNARTGELADELANLFDSYADELQSAPEISEFKVRRAHLQKNEAEKLAQLKTASRLGIGKDGVVISGLQQIFVPVWMCHTVFEENEQEFEIGAVEGNVLSPQEVPFRGQTVTDAARETLFDLTTPANWIHYAIDLIKSILGFVWSNPLSKWARTQFTTNRSFQISVLILILFLITLNELAFHWF